MSCPWGHRQQLPPLKPLRHLPEVAIPPGHPWSDCRLCCGLAQGPPLATLLYIRMHRCCGQTAGQDAGPVLESPSTVASHPCGHAVRSMAQPAAHGHRWLCLAHPSPSQGSSMGVGAELPGQLGSERGWPARNQSPLLPRKRSRCSRFVAGALEFGSSGESFLPSKDATAVREGLLLDLLSLLGAAAGGDGPQWMSEEGTPQAGFSFG